VAGWALAVAALVAFLARTPAKVAMVDRWRGRRLDRTVLAERVAAVEVAVLVALLVVAGLLAAAPFWLPLAVATPLVAVEAWYDVRSRSRRLIPELTGTIGIGSVAAAIILAGGAGGADALAAWAVVVARSLAAIPFVRTQLRRAKGQPAVAAASDGWQVAAVVIAAAGAAWGAIPIAGVTAIATVALFHAVAVRRPVPRVAIVGAQQVVLGLGVVVTTALGLLAP